jgi:hypothetical protein
MRKLIIATTALAFLSSTALVPSVALAQDKAGASDATKGDTTAAPTTKMKKSKHHKGKSTAKTGTDTMQKQQ